MKAIKAHEIESPANPLFKRFISLSDTAGIKKEGLFLLPGRKLVPEFLKSSPLKLDSILASSQEELDKLIYIHPNPDLKPVVMGKSLFKQIDQFNTQFPILVVQLPEAQKMDLSKPAQGLEVILPLGNPNNLGAAMRVCEAMSVSRVILTKESVNPFHPQVIRSSSGSSLRIPIFYSDLNDQSAYDGYLDLNGENVFQLRWPQNFRLFLGEEGRGVQAEMKKGIAISIPMAKSVESLNAVSAISMALYAYRSQHPLQA